MVSFYGAMLLQIGYKPKVLWNKHNCFVDLNRKIIKNSVQNIVVF